MIIILIIMIIIGFDFTHIIIFCDLMTNLLYQKSFSHRNSHIYFLYLINNLILSLQVGQIFFYNVMICKCISFTCVALLAEVNSFFLHTRKLLQMLDYSFDHKLYRVNAVLNIISFIVGRGLSLGTITLGMCYWYHRVGTFYYCVLFTSMLVMNSMIPVLLWRLIKNDFLRKDYLMKNLSTTKKPVLENGKAHVNNNVAKLD